MTNLSIGCGWRYRSRRGRRGTSAGRWTQNRAPSDRAARLPARTDRSGPSGSSPHLLAMRQSSSGARRLHGLSRRQYALRSRNSCPSGAARRRAGRSPKPAGVERHRRAARPAARTRPFMSISVKPNAVLPPSHRKPAMPHTASARLGQRLAEAEMIGLSTTSCLMRSPRVAPRAACTANS